MTEDGLKPDEVQPDSPVENQQADTLPDNPPDSPDVKVKALEEEKSRLEKEMQAVAKEKEELAARLKENQEYISRTRKVQPEKVDVTLPKKSFDDYVNERLKKFEEDPKEGFKQFITDVAYDRDLERQDYQKRIADAELNAFKRVLKLDPEKAKTMQAVEKLEEERPDLAALTFDQKLEWVRMSEISNKPVVPNRAAVDRDRTLAGGIASVGGRAERIPGWASDPSVMREAQGRFKSKQEAVDWANVENAEDAKRLMSRG